MPEKIYSFIVNSIPQGTSVQIEGKDNKGKKIIFVGTILFVSSKFIRIKVPNDKNITNFMKLKPDFIVRFQKGGYLCQFTTSPISYEGIPFSVVQVNFPKNVDTYSMRKSERVKVNINCKIRFYQTRGIKKNQLVNANIQNISTGGMQISTPITPVDKFILIKEISLPDGSILKPIDAKIKNKRKKDKTFILSIQFIIISEADSHSIKFFISKNLQSEKMDKPPIK